MNATKGRWTRELRPNLIVLGLSFGLTLPFAGNLIAQTPDDSSVVQVAGEPNLSNLRTFGYETAVQTASGSQQLSNVQTGPKDEPERNPQSAKSVKRAVNFIPPQRPIGQINIDLKSKPKGTSNIVPDDLTPIAIGEIPVVHAADSAEMFGGAVFASRRNHDDVFPYQPLYFEEANLERYGRSCGRLQPAISGVRFFGTIASMPYAMTVHHPNQAYTFRWPYDAGWGAPRVKELRPLQAKPTLVQAGVATGLFFVVP